VICESWEVLEVFNVLADGWKVFLHLHFLGTFVSGVFEHHQSFHNNVAVNVKLIRYSCTVQESSVTDSFLEPSFHLNVLLNDGIKLLVIRESASVSAKEFWHEFIHLLN